jgi:hypothetical protein
MVIHRFANARVSLKGDFPSEVVPVGCEPLLLEHALVCLLLEALARCKTGGGVEVSIAAEPPLVSFFVADDGVGISSGPEGPTSPRPLVGESGAGTPEGDSPGAFEIAEAMHATLTVDPLDPSGTVARIDVLAQPLPVEQPRSAHAGERAPSDSEDVGDLGPPVRLDGRVLPIRDVQRRYARWALERLGGHKTRTAESLGVDMKTLAKWLRRDSGA